MSPFSRMSLLWITAIEFMKFSNSVVHDHSNWENFLNVLSWTTTIGFMKFSNIAVHDQDNWEKFSNDAVMDNSNCIYEILKCRCS